jgi:hypothetical protein
MTETILPKKNIKYYFGYYGLFGQAAPVMWAEEDGIVVGGIPSPVLEKYEITEEEFKPEVHLADLARKYPVQLDMRTLVPKEPPTDLT